MDINQYSNNSANNESGNVTILANYKKYNPNTVLLYLAKNIKKFWYSNFVVIPAVIIIFAKLMHSAIDDVYVLTMSSTFIGFYNILILTANKYAKFTLLHYSQGQWVRKNLERLTLEDLNNSNAREYFNALDPEDTLNTKNYTRNEANIIIRGSKDQFNFAITEFYHKLVTNTGKGNTMTEESFSTLITAEGVSAPCDFRLQSINKISKIWFINKYQFETISSELDDKYFIERPVQENLEIALKEFLNNNLISAILALPNRKYYQIFFQENNLHLYVNQILDEAGLEMALEDLSNILHACSK